MKIGKPDTFAFVESPEKGKGKKTKDAKKETGLISQSRNKASLSRSQEAERHRFTRYGSTQRESEIRYQFTSSPEGSWKNSSYKQAWEAKGTLAR